MSDSIIIKYDIQFSTTYKVHNVQTAIARAVFLLQREGIGQFDREQAAVLESLKLICESHNTVTIEPLTVEQVSKLIGE